MQNKPCIYQVLTIPHGCLTHLRELSLCTEADRGEGHGWPTLPFLDQTTEAWRAEKNFFGDRAPPLSKGLDDPPPSSQGLDPALMYIWCGLAWNCVPWWGKRKKQWRVRVSSEGEKGGIVLPHSPTYIILFPHHLLLIFSPLVSNRKPVHRKGVLKIFLSLNILKTGRLLWQLSRLLQNFWYAVAIWPVTAQGFQNTKWTAVRYFQ